MSTPPNNSLYSDLPLQPGVYLMKNRLGKVLYVGKAKQLRNRVRQYFVPGRDGRSMVPYLTKQVTEIETIVVRSEKEALLLENTLIKRYQPKYNALLKDDKTFFSLMINHKHKWPMLKITRYKGKPPKGNLYFGPYTKGHAAKQTLDLLRTLFPLRQCSNHELAARTRPCILHPMGRCLAPCVNKCTKETYDALVERVIAFLKGRDKTILRDLKKEMACASKALEFEKADRLYKIIQAIKATLEEQQVEKAGRKDLDVIGVERVADRVALTVMQFRDGKLTSSHVHLFIQCVQDENAILCSFLLQHYEGVDERPAELVLPFELKEREILEKILGFHLHVPKRGNKLELIEMAKANAKEKLKKAPKEEPEQVLIEMEEKLSLTHFPERIECFDNSHLSGLEPVSGKIVFTDGRRDPKEYRKYKVSTLDDYQAMREVLTRRFKRTEKLPDLVIIDGGRGHLNAALEVLSDLDISTVDVIGVAKERGRHDKGMTQEQIFLPGKKEPILLKSNSKVLFLLQQIRDEAHRFAITFHKQRRKKRLFTSALDQVEGIGPVKKQRLLTHFGSVKRILEAGEEEWKKIPGITKRDLENLKKIETKQRKELQ
ncbi:MAG: UvrABC system protein C [Chlamydiales bacterium]|nr:UvrABC system protein C [Chlamydiales bacterium]MCH9619907.1 UvrABC system protein C [Chlamydiales bacterium]MCH9622666.1 UvrABC system protein C [Chlamydiales bacterium]